MQKQPKQYPDKLRRKVLRKVMDEGQPVHAVALACEVPERLIDHWVDEVIGERNLARYAGYSREDLLAERERLLREREYLLARRDIASGATLDMKGAGLDMAGLDPVGYEEDW